MRSPLSSVAGASEVSGANALAPVDESEDEAEEVAAEEAELWSPAESHSDESHNHGGWFCDASWLAPIFGPPELPDEFDGDEADGAVDGAEGQPRQMEAAAVAAAGAMDAGRDAASSETASEKGKPSFRKAFGMRSMKEKGAAAASKAAKYTAAVTKPTKKKGEPDPPPKCPWMTGISRKQRTMELEIARPVPADFDIEETGPVWEDVNKISVKNLKNIDPLPVAVASKLTAAAGPM